MDNKDSFIDNSISIIDNNIKTLDDEVINSESNNYKENLDNKITNIPLVNTTNINTTEKILTDSEEEIILNTNTKKKTNNTSININKKLYILNDLKYLTNDINKTHKDFIIDEYLQLYINDNIYNLISINNLLINSSSILLSDIYIYVMESYLINNDFNISIIYKNNNKSSSENLNIRFFGSIPILDENSNQIVFYQDYQSVNRYMKSLRTNLNEDILDNYNKLEKLCELKKKTHQMTNKHYLCMNKYFQIPSMLLTSGSGIVSFLASSSYFENQNFIFTITVGIASAVNTLFQSFSNTFAFATKAEAHQNATESYDQLLTSIRFEKMNNSIKPDIFINNIEKQILDIKQRCKYTVPDVIEETYNEHKFTNYKDNILRDVLKKLISLKTELYYNSIKNTDDYSNIDFSIIENELGLDRIKDYDQCCENSNNSECFCCFK
jgi:hypothetical protein